MGEIFTKLKKKKSLIILTACFTMKEGGNSKNYGSIVIPKARGTQKSLFIVSASYGERRYEH